MYQEFVDNLSAWETLAQECGTEKSTGRCAATVSTYKVKSLPKWTENPMDGDRRETGKRSSGREVAVNFAGQSRSSCNSARG